MDRGQVIDRRGAIENMKKLVAMSEEILDLKDYLEMATVERGKGSGLLPHSVEDMKRKLEAKKREHKQLWTSIETEYIPFIMSNIQAPEQQLLTHSFVNHPIPDESRRKTKKKTKKGTSCCSGKPSAKKKKKQTKKYKRMR